MECSKLKKHLPAAEKLGMISQKRRAALPDNVTIAEGTLRKSETESKRYYEIARRSISEIDAALVVSNDLAYLNNYTITIPGKTMVKYFGMLTGMIQSKVS